jgi:hypothetical protein
MTGGEPPDPVGAQTARPLRRMPAAGPTQSKKRGRADEGAVALPPEARRAEHERGVWQRQMLQGPAKETVEAQRTDERDGSRAGPPTRGQKLQEAVVQA